MANFLAPDGAFAFDHLLRLIEQVEAMVDLLVGAGDQRDFAGRERVLRRVVGQLRFHLLQGMACAGQHLDGVGDHQVDAGGDVRSDRELVGRRADVRGDFVRTLDGRLNSRTQRVDGVFGE